MVLIAPLVGAAVFLSGLASALPTSSSNYGSSDSSSSNYGSSSSDSSSNYGSSSNSGSSSNYGSSDSSNYGSSNSGSHYGSSGSNYGSSGSSYGSSDNNNYDSSSSSMMMSTSTTDNSNNQYTSTTSAYNNQYTSTTQNYNNQYTTSTTSASNSYQTSSNYGSGSSYWGGSGYEDCVNQCIAQFGGGSSAGGSYQATATSGYAGNAGSNGQTHTIVVAPSQGVLRFIPFATNASVGDTLEFHWGANNHTVTKSSQLLPCNKSSAAPVFASGEQNKDFVFTQVVNDTNPIFFYCGTVGHCEKGMFGMINPAMATPGAPTSVGMMMAGMAANDSNIAAYAAYTSNLTASNNAAEQWGTNFDTKDIPDSFMSDFMANVMFNRGVMAKNADVVMADNSMNLASVGSIPLDLPMDITTALDNAVAPAADAASASAPAPAAAAATGAASPSAASSSPSASSTAKNGASSVASPRMLVGAMVVLATVFAL
ncbi:hypothetical protein FB45DRAFT_990038 [Roridomyces roridus]|uniref:Phytocyanin domain-containing protein n=1 Tax=Roridomyces roridus TaxID=1738132 RepID=A0AAD7BWC7_9AGAR|nr:hypothetical protein FB45DRAFT_990038 [Roridomyces roridus]